MSGVVSCLASSELRQDFMNRPLAFDKRCLDLDAVGVETLAQPSVLLVSVNDVRSHGETLNEVLQDLSIFPLLVGPHADLRTAPRLFQIAPRQESPESPEFAKTIEELLARHGQLQAAVAAVDVEAEGIAQNSVCEWVRCGIGILGLTRYVPNAIESSLAAQLELIRTESHALVDRVPSDRLSTDELWTLLLIFAVPWTQLELDQMDQEAAILSSFVKDTLGSRKLVLPVDVSISTIVGPIAGSGAAWQPTTEDPLREQLDLSAANADERDALGILFKRRFAADDIDKLIAVLGRRD